MEDECCVPPGFRFHPTEEELVGYYLARKVASQSIDLDIIQEVDLYRMEPWDLLLTTNHKQQEELYFFSHKDRKYPSGTRTNRATAAGFWKATGRDKPVLSSSRGSSSRVIGMRKTLVFYKGRAPNGRKTDWIMHEYRLLRAPHGCTSSQVSLEEEGWVVCRAFRKPIPNHHHHQQVSLAPYHHHPNMNILPSNTTTSYGFFSGSSLPRSMFYPPQTGGEIPQLIDSPTIDDVIQQQEGGQAAAAGAIDWNFLNTLLLSSTALHDPATASSASSLQLQ